MGAERYRRRALAFGGQSWAALSVSEAQRKLRDWAEAAKAGEPLPRLSAEAVENWHRLEKWRLLKAEELRKFF